MSDKRVRVGDVVPMVGVIDWAQIVKDVKAALEYQHDSQIADLLNVPRTTLARWMAGSEPFYGYGYALIELHRKACGDACTLERITEAQSRSTRASS